MLMNEYDVADYRVRYEDHAVLGPATETLVNLMEAVNANSDGWPYWRAPSKASRRLQFLIMGGEAPTVAALRKAYTPLKSFRTRSGLKFEITEV